MDAKTIKREDEKYSWLYWHGYSEGRWKKLAKIALYELRDYHKNPQSSLIDFGCGKGGAIDFFTKKGFYCEGVEISSFLCNKLRGEGKKVYHSSIDNLFMIKDKNYDIGFSNDVLEHVPQDYVEKSISEMARVTKDYLFLRISLTLSKNLSREGENLHLTVWGIKKWCTLIDKFGKTKMIRTPFSKHSIFIVKLDDNLQKI